MLSKPRLAITIKKHKQSPTVICIINFLTFFVAFQNDSNHFSHGITSHHMIWYDIFRCCCSATLSRKTWLFIAFLLLMSITNGYDQSCWDYQSYGSNVDIQNAMCCSISFKSDTWFVVIAITFTIILLS